MNRIQGYKSNFYDIWKRKDKGENKEYQDIFILRFWLFWTGYSGHAV